MKIVQPTKYGVIVINLFTFYDVTQKKYTFNEKFLLDGHFLLIFSSVWKFHGFRCFKCSRRYDVRNTKRIVSVFFFFFINISSDSADAKLVEGRIFKFQLKFSAILQQKRFSSSTNCKPTVSPIHKLIRSHNS